MRIWIFTGGRPSNGAKEIAANPGFKRLRTGKFIKAGDVVVNWGTTKPLPTYHDDATTLNGVAAVGCAANKFLAFGALSGADISTVPWTANQAVAQEWLDAGSVVVCRKVLTGHAGAGIIIVEKGGELVEAPLYTKYVFKTKEFRVHATIKGVIDTQQKVRDPKQEPLDWKVRSHANGFIFQRNNIQPSLQRDLLAVKAVQILGLDFGAVDIIEDKHGSFYVLEVNTAPGLEGATIDSYVNALTGLAKDAHA